MYMAANNVNHVIIYKFYTNKSYIWNSDKAIEVWD